MPAVLAASMQPTSTMKRDWSLAVPGRLTETFGALIAKSRGEHYSSTSCQLRHGTPYNNRYIMKFPKSWQSVASRIAFVFLGAASLSEAVVVVPTNIPVRFAGPTPVWDIQTPSHSETRVMFPSYDPYNQIWVSASSDVDVDNSTIRVHGTVPATTYTYGSTQSFTWQSGTNPPVFPNPPSPIYSTAELSITVSITVPSFTFDTGVRPFAWDGNGYSFEDNLEMTQTATVDITHSLTTGEDVFAGSLHFTGDYILRVGPSDINTQGYPNQLTVGPGLYFTLNDVGFQPIPLSFGVAENGFTHSLYLIPEPSIAALFGFASCLFLKRRRR